jgi:polyisoprenoid-binding protein YceI
MKNIFLTISLAVITAFSFASKPHIDKVSVNTENSTIKWIGSKVASSHEGTVNIQRGILMINHGTLVGGQFIIDMNSILCSDMEGRRKQRLEMHLKNEDFFDVEQFPLATINITNAIKEKGGGNSYKIVATLTIKGITHPVAFDANVTINGLNFLATAKIEIDRTKWDIKYGSGSFFENLGDKMILDEIQFDVYLLSVK